jgi:heme exporter protein D
MENFWQMGGYAVYVWPSYALALIALGGIFIATRATLKKREREFEHLKSTRPEA